MRQRGADCGVQDGALHDVEAGLDPLGDGIFHLLDRQLHTIPQRSLARGIGLDRPCERTERQDLRNVITGRQLAQAPDHESQSVRLSNGVLEERIVVPIDKRLELLSRWFRANVEINVPR